MKNAQKMKLSERATAVALLSVGASSLVSVLTTEGFVSVILILLGIASIGAVVAGLHKRLLASLGRTAGEGLIGFLAVFLPLIGIVVFSLYPIGLSIGAAAGIRIPNEFIVTAIVSGLGFLANLLVLIMNVIGLLRASKSTSPALES